MSGPGLYVHLPWCVRKCPYCDFNSHALRDEPLPARRYTDALLQDLAAEQRRRDEAGERHALGSIFFGGGTPSLFPADQIGRVIAAARSAFGLQHEAEITLEANPGTIEHGRFEDLRTAGVNRISLGAQSFDAKALKALGRIHGPGEIFTAIDEIQRAGFDNFNVDLMYGLPGQSPAQAVADLRTVLDLSPSHISHYQLTIEPNTLFHAKPPTLPPDDSVHAMLTQCLELFASAGFEQYEVSAWAHSGRRGRHNLNYWRFGDYLGIGAGAHGKLTTQSRRIIERSVRDRHPQNYMTQIEAGAVPLRWQKLSSGDRVFEYPLNQLRLLAEPFDIEHFCAATLLPAAAIQAPLAVAVKRGLMRPIDSRSYATTDLGWRFLNDLQGLFLSTSVGSENDAT